MSNDGTKILERAHRDAMVDAHEQILKGDGKHQPGLVKRTEDLENYVREEKTTRRVLSVIFGILFTTTTSAGVWAMNKLADAVLARPIVVNSPAPARP